MIEDAELLRRYAVDRSQEAFAELVRRRVNLVYSVALRQVGGDAQLAEDVTQRVFADLARKATNVSQRAVLSGWLYRSAQFAATDVVRAERRRRVREQEAQIMNDLSSDAGTHLNWEKFRPVLDEVMGELNDDDRDAVALRFFERRSFAEIGTTLRLNEEAARKRVMRALDKMHALLTRRGVTSTTTALGLALANQAGIAAPTGLAATVTGGALAGAGVGAAGAVITIMSMTKRQVGVVGALVVAGAVGFTLQRQTDAKLHGEIESLRQQTGEVNRLREENRRLTKAAAEPAQASAEHVELARLRTELAALKNSPPSPATGAPVGPTEKPALAAGLVPVETLGNAGRATPSAALATQLWAAHGGDVELEATTIAFGPEARAKLEAFMAKLPENLRAEYGTPEQLMAAVMAGSPHPVGGMQVLDETVQGPDDEILHTRWQHEDDAVVHQDDLRFHHAVDGWRLVVSSGLADRAVAYLSRKPVTARPAPGNK